MSDIKGSKSRHLEGIQIIFGITGSVAAYKSIDVMRELIRRGATIKPVMTKESLLFINYPLVEWATDEKVFSEFSGSADHISLGQTSDLMIIAPATANTIAKVSVGIADDPVTLTAINFMGLGKSLLLVPSMHMGLWSSPQIKNAIERLNRMNAVIIPPVTAEGKAKFPPLEDVVAAAEALSLRGRDLKGIKVLVTAGPTREWLDSVRYISNPSSGLMGIEIARNAYFRGADVTLVHGPIGIPVPHYVKSYKVETAEEMLKVCVNEVKKGHYNAAILAGAPSDFKFQKTYKGKLSSSDLHKIPNFISTPKISAALREVFRGLIVGFAAEFAEGDLNQLIKKAEDKLKERGFNIVVANDISKEGIGFKSQYNEVVIIAENGSRTFVGRALKSFIATKILDSVKAEVTKA